MDYNHTEQPNMNFQQPNFNRYKRQPNKMATLSLMLGVLTLLSVISIYFIYFALPMGCMSILFAHLSKGDSYRLSPKAVGGMTVSILSIVITVVILVLGFYLAIQLFGLEIRTPCSRPFLTSIISCPPSFRRQEVARYDETEGNPPSGPYNPHR